ncbi:MAG: HAD family phosphatase [archaeon]|nr:HAD family phosphatase [archaeon]MCR4323918.1 HAD family phosphatase [Nanoarchaeota archaeon]
MIKGVIFDMDGVISDTQKLHAKIESEIFSRFEINLSPEEITKKYAGVKIKEFFQEVLKNKEYNLDELIKEKREKMIELASISVDPIPGSPELIKTLSENNIQLAVASASHINYVKIVLEKLNLTKYFKVIIGGNLVKRGKPHPESFLLAAKNLNLSPKDCLVIEDGISGMKAAKRAKMKCIGLVQSKKEKYPTRNLVSSLKEINIKYLQNL